MSKTSPVPVESMQLTTVPIEKVLGNPFRPEDERYDQSVIEALKEDMIANGMWPNCLAREFDSAYQLAYGHHRIEAARQLGLKEVTLLVAKLDDAAMLRAWAAENAAAYRKIDAAKGLDQIKAAIRFLKANPEIVRQIIEVDAKTKKGIETGMRHYEQRGPGKSLLARFLGQNPTRVSYYLAYLKMNEKDLKNNPEFAEIVREVKADRAARSDRKPKRKVAEGRPKVEKPKKPLKETEYIETLCAEFLRVVRSGKPKSEKVGTLLAETAILAFHIAKEKFGISVGKEREKELIEQAKKLVK